MMPEILRSGVVPDILTDQTSAHDALNGYVPHGMSLAEAIRLRERQPERYVERSMASIACHVEAMLALRARGAVTFDYGNNIRAQAKRAGVENAFDIPGFVPEYVRPLFCEGKGPFRWVALSGDPDDILATDQAALDMFSDDEALCRWIRMARARVKFQGLPARICWLGYGDRARFGHRDQRDGSHGSDQGADRHRPRSPRRRLGGVAVSRNGGHARRQRRDCRLASAECAVERVGRCDMGLGASRRRRRASATRCMQAW